MFGKLQVLVVFLMRFFMFPERCQTAIILKEDYQGCSFVQCESGQLPIGEDCICQCPLGRYGHFCELEDDKRFPGGNYLLPKPIYGCPINRFASSSLTVTFPADSDDVMDWFLKSSNLIGPAMPGGFQFNFCHRPDVFEDDPSWWMPGKYCLFQKGDNLCPDGFEMSRLIVNSSYTLQTSNYTVPTWPNVTVDANGAQSVGVCCRDDSFGSPLLMHHSSPFYLLKFPGARECQPIQRMEAREEEVQIFHWENGDNFTLCFYIPEPAKCTYHQGDGRDYYGKLAVTINNKPCIPWNKVVNDPYVVDYPEYYTENYCRGLDDKEHESSEVRCYVSPDKYEDCRLPDCNGVTSDMQFAVNAQFNYQNLNKLSFYSSKDLEPVSWLQVDLHFAKRITHFFIETNPAIKSIVKDLYVVVYVSKGPFEFMDKSAEACRKEFNLKQTKFVLNECYRPMVGRYLTIVKQRGSGDLKDVIRVSPNYGSKTQCGKDLGLTTGRILDDQVVVSSQTDHFKSDTLAFNSIGWCAAIDDDRPFVQIDLIAPMVVEGLWLDVVIYNREELYTTNFTIQYGMSQDNLKYITDDGGEIIISVMEFDVRYEPYWVDEGVGNKDNALDIEQNIGNCSEGRGSSSFFKSRVISEKLFVLPHSVVTRYIKISIVRYTGQPCLKLELVGCLRNVLRDVNCAKSSDFIGHGVTQRKKLDLPLADFERTVTVDGVLECLNLCDKNKESCKSIQYNSGSCTLRTPHRYNHHYIHKMVPAPGEDFYGQRLCIKEINYKSVYRETITQPGTVSTPSYPLYDTGIDWETTVRLPQGTFAILKILDISLSKSPWEDGIDTNDDANTEWLIGDTRPFQDCHEYFEIRNPTLTQSTMIRINYDNYQQFDGTVFRSPNNVFYLVFKTCPSSLPAPRRGFMLQISQAEDSCGGCDYVQDHSCKAGFSPVCDKSCGYLSSMYHPRHVNVNGLFCPWTIRSSDVSFSRNYVELQVIEFSMYSEKSSCELSSVTIYDTDYNRNRIKIGKYCSLNPPPEFIYSRWGEMTVEYSKAALTRLTAETTGFLLKYNIKTNTATPPTTENCNASWLRHDGGCYRLFVAPEVMTWYQARDKCQQHGGSLVNIESHQEMVFVYSLFFTVEILNNQDIYIGLKKIDDEFRWTNGNPMIYTSWEEKQPDGVGTENCVLMSVQSSKFSKSWNDVSCALNTVSQYICEVPDARNDTTIITEASILEGRPTFISNTTYQCKNREYISSLSVCDGVSDCSDASDEDGCDYTVCDDGSYRCNNGKCIPLMFYCNFKDDCGDRSDEDLCVPRNCSIEEWRCENGECIERNKRCNMIVDCLDSSDETNCDRCSPDSFQCYDGTCISRTMYCDGQVDCSGNYREDEPTDCLKNEYETCADYYRDGYRKSGKYLVLQSIGRPAFDGVPPWLGDGSFGGPPMFEDVTTSTDTFEVECDFTSDLEYIKNIFHHKGEGLMLINMYGPNDMTIIGGWGVSDVTRRYANCEQYIKMECLYNKTVSEFLFTFGEMWELFDLDSFPEGNCSCIFKDSCTSGQSRCTCSRPVTYWYDQDEFQFQTLEGYFQQPLNRFINDYYKLDAPMKLGPIVCKEERRSSEAILCDDGILISGSEKCLLTPSQSGKMKGCRDFTQLLDCDDFMCPPSYMKCRNSYCIHVSLVCNGKTDCLDNQDEDQAFCGNWTCPGFYRCKDSTVCLEMDQVCDGQQNCPQADDELMCDFECPPSCMCNAGKVTCALKNIPEGLPAHTKSLNFNNNRIDFTGFDLARFTLLGELHLSKTELAEIPANAFQFQVNLYHLDLSHNKLVTLTPRTFVGLVKLRVLNLIGNQQLKMIEPGAFQDLRSLPALRLDDTALTALQANTFQGLETLEELYLTNGSLQTVEDGAFESLIALNKLDLRNQDIETFSGGLFSGLDTLEYLYTDAYRFCCIKPASVSDDKCKPEADEFSSCTDLMRRETLRIFMWILGLVAVLGNFLTILYRLILDRAGFKRGYGIFVTSLGISDFLMGVYMLIIASADALFRGRYIWNDSWWRNSPFCELAGILTTVSSEASALFLCLITLDRFLIIKYPFGQYKFTRRSSLIGVSIVWLFSLLMGVIPILPGTGFSGKLYSRTGICLALPLTSDRTPGWQFSTGLFIFFNFFTFLLICLGQIMMYRSMVKSGEVVQSKERRSRDIEVARRLSLIVLTDFVCWFPICCMGLMALNNVIIDSEVYAWTAVFILPINSALNPLLYTISSILGKTKAKKALDIRPSASVDNPSSTLIKSMTSLWKSDHLQFGSVDGDICTSLGSVLASRSLTPEEMLKVAEKVIRAMDVVHNENLVVGGLNDADILLREENEDIRDIKLVGRVMIPDQLVTPSEDIYSFGKLVAKLLRVYASKRIR